MQSKYLYFNQILIFHNQKIWRRIENTYWHWSNNIKEGVDDREVDKIGESNITKESDAILKAVENNGKTAKSIKVMMKLLNFILGY